MKKRGFIEKLLGKSSEEDEVDLSDLDRSAREMIRGVVTLSDTNVREIMVPRIDMVSISLDTPTQESLKAISECGHSRVPVYHETIDNVVGILYAKDLLHYLVKKEGNIELEKIIRPAYFVPESKKLDSLLTEFQRRRVHIAIVVDEYGGTSGIVCLEDIIEEIVGEIQDEFDNETEDILKISDGVYLCDARVNLEDFNEQLKLNIPAEDFDSLGGFVFDLFGKIPVKYEKMSYKNLDFIIQQMEGHKISNVKIVIHGEGVIKKEKEEK
ncbi:Magnesium and cobalt efflux protein CorC [subsurface metagenome]